jgi:hypothetical protein
MRLDECVYTAYASTIITNPRLNTANEEENIESHMDSCPQICAPTTQQTVSFPLAVCHYQLVL